jgi:predicted lipoprotein
MIRTIDAILSLVPNAECTVSGNQIILWESQETQPTEAEITAEIARLQTQYDANEYQRQRAQEYPSIADQLDTLYHSGLDAWKAQIKTVKDKYPKA